MGVFGLAHALLFLFYIFILIHLYEYFLSRRVVQFRIVMSASSDAQREKISHFDIKS